MDLYFIAIALPQQLNDEIRSFQREMADKYNSSRQLKIPVHITLLPPFKSDNDQIVIKAFEKTCHQLTKPENVRLSGFGEFRNKVLFVKVDECTVLRKMRNDITDKMTKLLSLELPEHYQHFHPHITIANRDLSRRAFLNAWPEFRMREYNANFSEMNISLFKHIEGNWQIIKGA